MRMLTNTRLKKADTRLISNFKTTCEMLFCLSTTHDIIKYLFFLEKNQKVFMFIKVHVAKFLLKTYGTQVPNLLFLYLPPKHPHPLWFSTPMEWAEPTLCILRMQNVRQRACVSKVCSWVDSLIIKINALYVYVRKVFVWKYSAFVTN